MDLFRLHTYAQANLDKFMTAITRGTLFKLPCNYFNDISSAYMYVVSSVKMLMDVSRRSSSFIEETRALWKNANSQRRQTIGHTTTGTSLKLNRALWLGSWRWFPLKALELMALLRPVWCHLQALPRLWMLPHVRNTEKCGRNVHKWSDLHGLHFLMTPFYDPLKMAKRLRKSCAEKKARDEDMWLHMPQPWNYCRLDPSGVDPFETF